MRLLKQIGIFFCFPFLLLIDAPYWTISGILFPHCTFSKSFSVLFLLFETIEVSEYLYLAYCFIVGLVYDIYFFHLIGIATLLFILLGASSINLIV